MSFLCSLMRVQGLCQTWKTICLFSSKWTLCIESHWFDMFERWVVQPGSLKNQVLKHMTCLDDNDGSWKTFVCRETVVWFGLKAYLETTFVKDAHLTMFVSQNNSCMYYEVDTFQQALKVIQLPNLKTLFDSIEPHVRTVRVDKQTNSWECGHRTARHVLQCLLAPADEELHESHFQHFGERNMLESIGILHSEFLEAYHESKWIG